MGCPALDWGLHPKDFIPVTDASSSKNFWVMRQEKALALAWVIQACAKESGAPTGVLCDAVQEPQGCMVPVMALNKDDIVEASLLKSTEEEHGISPIPEEKAILLAEEIKLPQVPEISEGVEPARWITTPRASSPSPASQSNHCPSQRARESWRGIDADPNHPKKWVCFYLQEHDRVPEWWVERVLVTCLLHRQKCRPCPSPRFDPPASHCLQAASCTTRMRWLMDHPTLPRVAGVKKLPSASRLQGNTRLLSSVS